VSLSCLSGSLRRVVFYYVPPTQFVADYRAGELVICDYGILDMIRQGRAEVSKPRHVHVF